MEDKLNIQNLIYKIFNKGKNKTHDQKFKVITYFGREIYNNNLSLVDAHEQQIIYQKMILIF